MQLDTPLGKDESLHQEYEFTWSVPFVFLKSHFWLTNKRLIVNFPTNFLFIPTGNNTSTYPLRAIGGVRTKTQLKFIPLFFGIVFLSHGCHAVITNGYGLFSLIFGVLFLIQSFQTVIVVTSASTESTIYSHVPWEAATAKKMINQLNQLIVDNDS